MESRATSVRFSEEDFSILDRIASSYGLDRTSVIKIAIRRLDSFEKALARSVEDVAAAPSLKGKQQNQYLKHVDMDGKVFYSCDMCGQTTASTGQMLLHQGLHHTGDEIKVAHVLDGG